VPSIIDKVRFPFIEKLQHRAGSYFFSYDMATSNSRGLWQKPSLKGATLLKSISPSKYIAVVFTLDPLFDRWILTPTIFGIQNGRNFNSESDIEKFNDHIPKIYQGFYCPPNYDNKSNIASFRNKAKKSLYFEYFGSDNCICDLLVSNYILITVNELLDASSDFQKNKFFKMHLKNKSNNGNKYKEIMDLNK
jgi:hypothetical protein